MITIHCYAGVAERKIIATLIRKKLQRKCSNVVLIAVKPVYQFRL